MRDVGPEMCERMGDAAEALSEHFRDRYADMRTDVVIVVRVGDMDGALVAGVCSPERDGGERFKEALELAYEHVLSKPGADEVQQRFIR